jgi:hypothetical protein
MKNTFLILIFSFLVLQSCDQDALERADYVGFELGFSLGVDAALVTSRDVNVYTATVSSSARTFNIAVNTEASTVGASAYTVPTSVSVPANSNVGTFTVDVNGPNLGSGGALVLSFGEDSNVFTGDDLTINLFPVCFDNTSNLTLTLDITFDDWPEEIYWILEDGTGAVIAESAPSAYGAYAGLTGGISQDFCLSDGSYTFTIYDGFGDGSGPYQLSFSDGTIVHSSDGAYDGGEAVSFEL